MTYTKFDLKYDDLNPLEKAVVRHAHPKAFILHLIGLIWSGYFLWTHNLLLAIFCFGGITGVGQFLGYCDKNYLKCAQSKLNLFQKMLVYHANYKNLIYHIVGFAFFVWGAYENSFLKLLIALSFVLLGHMFAWHRHHCETIQHECAIEENDSPHSEPRL
ncbi:MAG: hypothetical protein HYW47_05205 [Deltaproteobacteria bacterium]|nr:hypothetical protein [Deltaproteobacteria bacterium]